MDSRNFPTVETELLRGTTANTIDTGYIPANITAKDSKGVANRGVEHNTARGVKMSPMMVGMTAVEYGSNADVPEVIPFKVYGDN